MHAIVIGGGIAGCSTAFALACQDVKVTLIERHQDIAQAASGNPIAMLYPKLSAISDAASNLGIQGLRYTLDMLKTLDPYELFHASSGQIQLAFDARASLQHAKTAQQPFFHELPFTARFVDAEEASEIAGIPVKHLGLFIPEAGWVDPYVWCTRLTSLNNIERTLDTTALRIEHTDHGWRVHSAQQTFEAEHVVLCNAYDACELMPQLRPFLTLVRGQINFAAPSELSQYIRSVICAQHFISPAVNGLHTLGTTYANHDMTPECTDCDTKTNLQALSQINTDLPKTLDPSLHPGRVGWRCATMDYLPMVGQMLDLEALQNKPPRPNASSRTLPWLQGLYVNIGHGSKGMITAPLSGDWLAGIITGQIPQNPLLVRIQPNRFKMRELGLKQLAQHIYG